VPGIARIAGVAAVCLALAPALAAQDGWGKRPVKERVVAPSLDGGVAWFNTAEPVDWARLRGKVVLLDFWTFG